MAQNTFTIGEAVRYGFETVKKNFAFFLVLLLIIFGTSFVPSFVAGFFEDENTSIIGFVLSLAGWALQMIVSLGTIGIALKIHDKKKAEYKNLFDYVNLVIPYFFASLLYGLIVIGGFILLIIPGIVWSIKFRYYSYFMVDKNMGPIEALKASAKITEGFKWRLFLLGLTLGLINLVGLMLLLVGLFFTAPLAMMAEAYVFRKLQGSK